MNYEAITFHYCMADFRLSVWGFLLEGYRRIATHLEHATVALWEGKALGLLQDELVGVDGVTRMEIENPDGIRGSSDITLRLCVNTSLSPEEGYRIRWKIARVNRRYGMRVRLSLLPEPDEIPGSL